MYEWIGFDDFQPATGMVYTSNSEQIDLIVHEARKLIPGWSDKKINDVTWLLFDEADRYIRMVIKEAEEVRCLVIGTADACTPCEILDEYNCDGETIEFVVVDKFIRWPDSEIVNDVFLSDMISQYELCEFIATNDKDPYWDWTRSESLIGYTDQQLMACLALNSIATVITYLKTPCLDHWWSADQDIPFYQASHKQQLEGTELAMSNALMAAQYLLKAHNLNSVFTQSQQEKKKQKKTRERKDIARKGGKAKAGKYAPLKEFVIEFYHKSNTTILAEVARKAVKPAKAFCEEKHLNIHLAPTNIERTFKSWLRDHRKRCPICEKKLACNTVA